jgi:DMSO/TMAO reductase YedYZ heme-binding membrane subunit
MASSSNGTLAPTRLGFGGTRIVYAAIAGFGLMCSSLFVLAGGGEEGVRIAIRATARTTLLVFVVVFCTTALKRRWPGSTTRWLARNRRYLGLSAATSHAYHLAFILALYAKGWGDETSIETVIGGSFGFLMLFLMALTSNNASQRRLRRGWRRLHLLGMYSMWVIYAVSYLPGMAMGVLPAVASLVLVAAIVLRLLPAPKAASVQAASV